MKRFNTHLYSGMSFIEVVIALAIMALLLTPILVLQTSVFKRVVFNAQRFSHFMPVKDSFSTLVLEPLEAEQTTREIQKEDPAMQIVYTQEKIANQSLARFKDLYIQKSVGTWQEWDGQKEEVLLLTLFKPESEEQQEDKKS